MGDWYLVILPRSRSREPSYWVFVVGDRVVAAECGLVGTGVRWSAWRQEHEAGGYKIEPDQGG